MIHALKVPVGVINSIEDALAEPQIVHRNLVVNIPHRLNENFQMIGSPSSCLILPLNIIMHLQSLVNILLKSYRDLKQQKSLPH